MNGSSPSTSPPRSLSSLPVHFSTSLAHFTRNYSLRLHPRVTFSALIAPIYAENRSLFIFFLFFFLLPSSPSSVPPLPIALSFTFHLSRSSLIIFILRWRLDGWWRKQTGMSGSSLSPPFFSYIFFSISCHYCAAETRRKGGGDRKSNGKERKKYLKKDGFTKRKRCRK